ncbi:MAG: pyridoxamine 5'-phosphate oxidase [Bacteroidales bacterium]|nr:pyridoxamine 5'-phosphate oxidase [Bacteroidales bacterium]
MELRNISNTKKDPFNQFSLWYNIIRKENRDNYNGLALSTAGVDGRVSSRMVLLKKYDKKGFVFFTNYGSRKGLHLSQNPYASMLFYWPEHGRQVRIEGRTEKVSKKESDEYFNTRIQGHKLNALASDQSTEIPDRQYLLDRYNEMASMYHDTPPTRPDHWGGYRLVPDLFEFWEEGENRLHDRLEYRLLNGRWVIRRLAP